MKIYVWDNGRNYSDHKVWFIFSPLDEETTKRFLQDWYPQSEPYLVGVAEMDVYSVKDLEPLSEWAKNHYDFSNEDDGYQVKVFDALPSDIKAYLTRNEVRPINWN